MRGNALEVRVFHKLEINEHTTFASTTNGYSTLTRRGVKGVDAARRSALRILRIGNMRCLVKYWSSTTVC